MNPYDPDYLFFNAPMFIKPPIDPASIYGAQPNPEIAKAFDQGVAPFNRRDYNVVSKEEAEEYRRGRFFRNKWWKHYFEDKGPRPESKAGATLADKQDDFMQGLLSYKRVLKRQGVGGAYFKCIRFTALAPEPFKAAADLARDEEKDAIERERAERRENKTPLSKRDIFGLGPCPRLFVAREPNYTVGFTPMNMGPGAPFSFTAQGLSGKEQPSPAGKLGRYAPRPFGAERHLVYLAGPMSGIENHNAPEFSKYASSLRAHGHFVFNPAEADMASGLINKAGTITDENRHKVLRADLLKILNDCHLVVAMPGWRRSRGARMEMAVALECGIEVAEVFTGYYPADVPCILPLVPSDLELLRSSFGPDKS